MHRPSAPAPAPQFHFRIHCGPHSGKNSTGSLDKDQFNTATAGLQRIER